jgi:hypothetical protein
MTQEYTHIQAYEDGENSATADLLIRLTEHHDIDLPGETAWEILDNLVADWKRLKSPATE